MICVKCKKDVPDGIKFCPYCGSKQDVQPVVKEQSAPAGQTYIPVTESAAPKIDGFKVPSRDDDDKTVSLMGETQYIPKKEHVTHQTQTQTPPPFAGGYYPNVNPVLQDTYTAPSPEPAVPAKKKKSPALIIVPIIFAVLIIIAISVFAILFGILDKNKGSEKADYITYLTSNELYYAEKDSLNNPIKIADVNYDDAAYYYVVENTVVRGDKVFYIQDVEYVDNGPVFSVYMRNAKKNGEPVKIDSDVTSCYFAVDPKGEKVVYTKDSVVYYNDLESAYRIASDVEGWCVDENVENIMFLRNDGETLALCTAKVTENASPEILVSGITELHMINDDMTEIVYEKEDGLYICENGNEKFIDDKIEGFYAEDGETFYYVVASDEGVAKSTYFNDDLAAGDAYVTEPDINDYQQYYYGFSFTSPEYYDALEEYNVKLNRDRVRALAAEKIYSYDLCYYNGTAGTVVCKDVDTFNIYCDGSQIVFDCYDAVKARKFNMSDLSVVEDFETYLLEARNETVTTYYASGSKIARDIAFENADQFKFLDKTVYYLDNCNSNTVISAGDLKKIAVASDGTVTSTLIDREVNSILILDDAGKLGYFKELNNNQCGKFYVDGELIEEKVLVNNVSYIDGKYYLLKNYNMSTNKGELCIVENGETSVVSETASGYNTRMEGVLFYSSDMKSDSDYSYTFNINCYDGKDSALMASDAVTWQVQPDYFLGCDKEIMVFLTGYRNYYYE